MATDPWDAGTWEGARRAQLQRALQRTVRERLEVLEGLTETSRRLIELGRAARERRESDDASGPTG
ncbi:MAG: hypothetical protein ACODAA_09540 [Gemmatimonadota bacterium]